MKLVAKFNLEENSSGSHKRYWVKKTGAISSIKSGTESCQT